MKEQVDEKTKKRKKLLMLIPLFILAFASLFYFAITAGNSGKGKKSRQDSTKNAFNTKLPAANIKQKAKDKFEEYMQAQQDSARRKDALDKDPYQKKIYDPGPPETQPTVSSKLTLRSNPLPRNYSPPLYTDPNEKKVNEIRKKIYAALNEAAENTSQNKALIVPVEPARLDTNSAQQLQNIIEDMEGGQAKDDKQMRQIETVLDKLLDVQHPERITKRLKQENSSKSNGLVMVSSQPFSSNKTLLDSTEIGFDTPSKNEFFGLNDLASVSAEKNNQTILVVIHEDQTVYDDSRVKLRLLQPIYVGEIRIPKDNFIYGTCTIAKERVNLRVKSITFNNIVYPVDLTGFASDGMEGVNVPGAVGQEASRNGINQALQNIELYSPDPSIASQAAAAGVQTAKSMLGKKIRREKAVLKAGQTILLRPSGVN